MGTLDKLHKRRSQRRQNSTEGMHRAASPAKAGGAGSALSYDNILRAGTSYRILVKMYGRTLTETGAAATARRSELAEQLEANTSRLASVSKMHECEVRARLPVACIWVMRHRRPDAVSALGSLGSQGR